ncbi:MAG: D-(-)-3-hydroxybutyrate oligomer hydrolase [Piscinibacter sp.]|nr:D-(-)-3-hydroxybutyrate oligomer hydrolase [Piscinibacter sp.]
MKLHLRAVAAAAAALLALPGAGVRAHDDDHRGGHHGHHGDWRVRELSTMRYDGVGDDLLTAGVGKTGLLFTSPAPTVSSPATAAELRRLAIVTNYRAIVDTSANGGFGSLYGPNVDNDGVAGPGEGKIAGTETIAYLDDGSGRENVTVMVQVPASFDVNAPCIVTATSSGSRGVYGAIGSSGEWGLKHGCAVAYTDKGTGNGVHDLQNDTVNLIDGRRADATTAGKASNFTARLTAAELAAFNAATPNRFAVKHAHSQRNPEKDWGRHTLQAVEFAFWLLNAKGADVLPEGANLRRPITKQRTLVIASSVSNGAGAALAAAEQDDEGLIDGVAVSEPNITLAPGRPGTIQRGSLPPYTAGSRPLFDYFSYGNLLQPCAALSAGAAGSPFGYTGATAAVAALRCDVLARDGLVTGATTDERAADALAKLRAFGYEPESDVLQASMWLFATPAIAVTYGNTYGRFSVRDHLCGFSFGTVDATGAAAPASAVQLAQLASIFATGNGVPPSGPIQIVYNDSVGGAKNHTASVSPSTGTFDFAYDGAACLRRLWTGGDANAWRVKHGIGAVQQRADLNRKPTIIVHGRSDTLIPTNFTSRPYVLRNAQVEGRRSRLSYIEVTNGQHFDAFLPFAGFDTRYIPLHVYYVRAMDAMWAHLKHGAALPPSQVVRTTPRGGTPGAAPAITAAHVPAISASPLPGDQIVVSGSTMTLPD